MKKRVLSILLTLTLCLSLLPTAALAEGTEETYAASVTKAGESEPTNYTTLGDALTAARAANGSTLTLLANHDGSVKISSGTFTLDLNGYTISSDSTYTVTVESPANVTVKDSSNQTGKITGTRYGVSNSGTLRIDGGTVTGDWYGVTSSGTLTINGGTVEATGNNRTAVGITGGTANITGGTVRATGMNGVGVKNDGTGKVTVSGMAKIEATGTGGASYGVHNTGTGTVKITGGTVSGTSRGVNTVGLVNITGGTVTGGVYGVAIEKVYNSELSGNATISGTAEIEGTGDNSAGVYVYNGCKLTVSGGASITGGSVAVEYLGGPVDLSDWTNADGAKIYSGTSNVEVSDSTIKLPAGMSLLLDGVAQTTLTYGKTYTVGEEVTYTVTIADGVANGTVTADKTTAVEGETVTLTINPAEGYQLDYIYIDGERDLTAIGKTQISFTMPEHDVNISADFKKGSIVYFDNSTSKWSRVFCFDGIEYALEHKLGNDLHAFIVDTETVRFTNYKSGMPDSEFPEGFFITEAITPVAGTTYTYTGYDVTVADTTGGTVAVATDAGFPITKASEGQTVMLTVTPDSGKRVSAVVIEDASGNPVEYTDNGDGTYTYTQPAGNVTIEVTFRNIPVADNYVEPTYRPTIDATEGGSTSVNKKNPEQGEKVTITAKPDEGYEVEDVIVTDRKGNEVEVKDNGDGTYSFKQPYGKVTITVTYVPAESDFTDVSKDSYYYDAVNWAVAHDITSGTGNGTTFSPNAVCTRAQAVTFLWRSAGASEPETAASPFEDVAPNAYYYKAVLWAAENGVTGGTSATTFSPDATVTRAQIVTFLWRMAGSPAAEQTASFGDVAADTYYHDAVVWAADEAITSGTSATTFSPADPCLRSQIVTFLYRYYVD